MRLFDTNISLRGKAILIAAASAAVSVPFSIGVLRAQNQPRPAAAPNIVGDYRGLLTPPGSETPQLEPRPEPPRSAVRPGEAPKWDAVSIRPCPPPATTGGGERGRGGGGGGGGGPYRFSSDRMTLNCLSVRSLIRSAYHVYREPLRPGPSAMNDVLIFGLPGVRNGKNPTDGTDGGPEWIDTDGYTIEAKAEVVTDRALMQGPMLQTILEDRFKIKVHKETREIAVDALVIAKGGSKLKPFVEGSCIRRPEGTSRNLGPIDSKLNMKANADGKLSGTLSFATPDREQTFQLTDVRVEGQNLSFALRVPEDPSRGPSWKGSIENNGGRLNGAITQNGASMPLVLTRETAIGPAQEAEKSKFTPDCRMEGGGLNFNRNPPPVNIPYHAEGVTIGEFIQLFLSGNRPRYVLDNTGLTGKFDIHFEAEVSAEVRQRLGITDDMLGPSTAPPFSDALQQQLGLRLESTKGPVQLLVIDHVERPSPN